MANSLNEAFTDLRTAAKELQNSVLRAIGLTVKNSIEYPKLRKINNSPLVSSWCSKSMSFWVFLPKSDFVKTDLSIQDAKSNIQQVANNKITELGYKKDFFEWLIIDNSGSFLENELVFLTENNYNDILRKVIQQCKKYDLFYFRVRAHIDSNIFEGYIPPCQQ